MPKVAVLGWYNHASFGDDLILEGFKQLFKGYEIIVLSNDKKGSLAIDFDQVNKCDLFVLGGGELIMKSCLFSPLQSVFNRINIPYLSSIYELTSFAKRSWIHRVKIPKMVLGCGVNAHNVSELSRWTVNGLEQFDFIGLRDNVSVNILKSFPQLKSKVNLFYDLAFSAIDKSDLPSRNPNGSAIVIPTDRFTFGDSGVRVNNIAVKSASWLKEKLCNYEKTIFLAFGKEDNNDYETCKTLSDGVRNSEIVSYDELTLPKVFGLLSEASMVFPYRLHGSILSYLIGVPYEFYPYHWKLQRVHDTIIGVSPEVIRQKQKEFMGRFANWIN